MHIPKFWFTITLLAAFLVGITALHWWQTPEYFHEIWIILLLSAVLFLSIGLLARSRLSLLFLCIIIGISFAFLRVQQTTHVLRSDSIDAFAIDRSGDAREGDLPVVMIHGYISAEPDRRPMVTKYTVEVDEIRTSAETRSWTPLRVHGKVLVTDHAFYPTHEYGDEVLVSGILEKPTAIEDFAYDHYLSRFGIYAVMYRGSVETISTGHGNRFYTLLYSLKDRFENKLNRLLPEPHASFMAGLLTGSRRGIPEHLLKDFQATGLTHIIAISGYNIAIVIAVISSVLFFLPLQWRLFPSLLAIIFFTLFVGASPSVVRAACMGALGLFALQVGREKHSFIAILLTATVMTAWNPKVLWYDAGFQLSFLAVLGLAYLSPFLERPMKFIPAAFGIRESLTMTIAAQIAAVPLVVLLFGNFSLVAPLANVLVAPLIPLAMLFGFLGTLAGFFSEPLGLLVSYPGFGALDLVIRIARFCADVPYAFLDASSVTSNGVIAYYAILLAAIVACFFWKQKNNSILFN